MKVFSKKALFAIFVLIAGALISIWFCLEKPHRDAVNEEAMPTTPEALFNSVYLKGEQQFLDKTIEFKGEINELQPGKEPVCVIEIPGATDAGIRVSFDNRYSVKLANYKQGDQIRLKGICTGVLADTLMEGVISVDVLIRSAVVVEE